MIGANLLRTADQHGHSVQVMLNMYAKWLKGATPADIEAIRVALEGRPSGAADDPQDAVSARKEKPVAERVGFEPTDRFL